MSGWPKAWVAWIALVGAALGAENPPAARSEPTDAPPVFRRLYVPAKDLETRAWDGAYLPIDSQEFERLLDTVANSAADGPGGWATRIEKAEYPFTLTGDELLTGDAILRLSRRSNRSNLLVLDPCNLAVGAVTWIDQDGKPGSLGTGPDGRLRVPVLGSKLSCALSLRGERTASGAVSFHLELPESPLARLTLDAARGVELLADAGVVSKASGPNEQTNRWTVELGGHNRLNLRIVPEESARQRRPLTLLRQSLQYQFSLRGVNVSAQLKLDVHGEPLERLAVDLDPSLRLVAARYGDQDVPWSAITDVETHISHVVLQLPEPIVGSGRVLQLSAICPLTSGKLWRLPGLQAEGVSWQEGTATLLIPDAFMLNQLVTDGCRQSRVTVLPAAAAGESIEVQYYRPAAKIEVLVDRRREQLKIEGGTLVDVSGSEIVSRQGLRLSIARGERPAVELPVRAGWAIDAVENWDSDKPLEWEFDDSTPSAMTLAVRLPKVISPESAGQLVVRGHRRPPATPTFLANELEMLDLSGYSGQTRLIGVRAADGFELRWLEGNELNRRDTLGLSTLETQLFPRPPAGVLFVEDGLFGQSSLAVDRRKPNYSVDIRIDAAVQKQSLTETCTVQCMPEATRIERLLIRFSQAREAPIEWSLAGGNSGQFSARRLSSGEQAQAGLAVGGEAWEINLRLTRPGPFELRGVRSAPFTGELAIALASIAEATSQRGTVSIRSLGQTGMSIQNRRLASVPAELVNAQNFQTARGAFHYQPMRDDLGSDAAISIAPAPPSAIESGAWAWDARLESRYAAGESCMHQASFRIQTAGRSTIRVRLPEGARFEDGWVGERRVSPSDAAVPSVLDVELPAGRAFATLTLRYGTSRSLPRLAANEQPPFPQLDIPVMARQWSIWLPPGYEINDGDDRFAAGSIASPSWTARLFSLLGSSDGAAVFNPLSGPAWREVLSGDRELQRGRLAADGFLANLGAAVANYADGEELSWGELLASIHDAETQSGRALWIDAEALRPLELHPQTIVRFQAGDSDVDRGIALFEQSHLLAIVRGDVVVLTSTTRSASYVNQLAPPVREVIYPLAAGPLADQLREAGKRPNPMRFQTVEVWRATPRGADSNWPSADVASQTDEAPGRANYILNLSSQDERGVRIVHASGMRALALSLFLGLLGIGLWKGGQQPSRLLALVTVGVVGSLLLAPSFAPLASAVFLAGVVGLAWSMIRWPERPQLTQDKSRASHKQPSGALRPVAMLLGFVALVNLSQLIAAAQPPDEPQSSPTSTPRGDQPLKSPAAPSPGASEAGAKNAAVQNKARAKVHRVIVPVDDQQRPTGDKIYVPQELYRQLYRQAATASGQPKGWMISRGYYEGALARDPANGRFTLTQLKASFDVEVAQANVLVQLPFAIEGGVNPIVAARVEGRSVTPQWNAAGTALAIGPLPPDRYRIEFDLRPPQQTDVSTSGFDLAIPVHGGSTFELALPADAPAIELPAAVGRVEVRKDRGKLFAQLGPCNRLTVRWPTAGATELAGANLEVEELIWAKVGPGTTVLDARFKYHVVDGRVARLRVLADPRLRLLPPTAQRAISAVHTVPGDPQKIEFELAEAVRDEFVLDLSFLVTGTSGVGHLGLPRLESIGARASKRWLAVSVDPALQFQVQAGEDSKAFEVPEFLAAWGAAENKPLGAYRIPRGQSMWGLATEPGQPTTSAEQSLSVSMGRNRAIVQFDNRLTISGGYLFQVVLALPPALSVDQISLLEDGIQRVARWSVDDHGRATVLLAAPVNGRQLLSVRGQLAGLSTGAFPLPKFELQGATIKKREFRVFRQPAVLAKVAAADGIHPFDSEIRIPEGFGSEVGSYVLDEGAAPPVIEVAPNQPRTKAIVATYLERDADRWMAELECHAEVVEGLVDSLELEIPPQWSEPFSIEPPMPFRIVPLSGDQRRHLVLYPARPIEGKYQLKLRGRVALSAGDRLRVPDIIPLATDQLERFVVLPQHLDLQQLTWDTVALARAALPADFVTHAASLPASAVYRVSGDHFQASLKAVQRARAAIQVRLADVRLAWQSDGRCHGVAAYDLEPQGAAHCVVEMPGDHQILHASVESLPAIVTALPNNRWRVTLGPQQLPQRLEIVFSGPLAGSSALKEFQAPRLMDVEIERTLWSVYGPAEFGPPRFAAGMAAVRASEQDVQRLAGAGAMVQLPTEIVGEHLPEELVRWYHPWKARYSAARAALDAHLVAEHRGNGQSEEAIEASRLDQQIQSLDGKFGSVTAAPPPPSLAELATEKIVQDSVDSVPALTVVRGDSHQLVLDFPDAPRDAPRRWLMMALVLLAGGVAILFLRRVTLPHFAPTWVVGVAGLAWWLWMVPSVLGFIVFVAAGAAALFARWQSRPRPLRG